MRIYLTEGFAGESLRLTVNGAVLLDLAEARTNYSTGLAASAVTGETGELRVVVEIPARGIRAEHTTRARDRTALLIQLGEQGVAFQEAAEPVRFM